MKKKNNLKAWLYLLPAILFLGVFMLYPLVDVCFYSLEENFHFVSQKYSGIGLGNFRHVLTDPYFAMALKNTLILVAITVPVSTGLSLLIALGLSSVQKVKKLFQTILIVSLGGESINFIEGTYWQKMMVTCLYTIWIVMPFKILILTSALASVNPDYYKAARVDGASSGRIFRKITLPMISPTVFYLIITGFIGAFKAYSDEVALFGTNLNAAEMNTIVGYVYDMLYSDSGGFPGYAAAAALLLFAIVFTITYVNLRFSRNKVQYM